MLSKAEQIAPPSSTPGDQKIEHLVVEDSGTRIEELRVGGESQAVTVQPKAPVPAWQMLRESPAHGGGLNDTTQTHRARVWNILNF